MDAPPGTDAGSPPTPATLLLPVEQGRFAAVELNGAATAGVCAVEDAHALAARVRQAESDASPRWVVRRAPEIVSSLLAEGTTLGKAWDLELCHAILAATRNADLPPWPERTIRSAQPDPLPAAPLFDWTPDAGDEREGKAQPDTGAEASAAQYRAQRMYAAADPRLLLLCHAESAGAVVAEEMRAAGVPWDRARHEQILTETLGVRAAPGGVPEGMARLAAQVRDLLEDETLNLDSPARVLQALHRAGVGASSTSQWELAEYEHPAIEPLLAYKKRARLYVANGWNWLADWVHDGRFRPVYIPGGVVTGRWASAGGGALQIPRVLRGAVRADPGWRLVVADVAQLEPRMLAAMSGDLAMAHATQGTDLYAGVVASGAVDTREHAKYAVLGAMYGATTGMSGQLVPRLRRVFPRAMGLVDEAARTGADGGLVTTWLGRTSPPPSAEWHRAQRGASLPAAGADDERRARRAAADRGRFTRNFIVQGTAAEWSLIWLAEMRHRLAGLPAASRPAAASGPVFAHRAHLAFFLHDEVIVHTPAEHADAAAHAVREAAEVATTRMFGAFPLEVPLDLRISTTADTSQGT